MIITIYGIPEDVGKCYGCISAINLCDELGLSVTLIPVVRKINNGVGFEYIREKYEECRIRAGKDKIPVRFPQIFVDNEYIGSYAAFKERFDV